MADQGLLDQLACRVAEVSLVLLENKVSEAQQDQEDHQALPGCPENQENVEDQAMMADLEWTDLLGQLGNGEHRENEVNLADLGYKA